MDAHKRNLLFLTLLLCATCTYAQHPSAISLLRGDKRLADKYYARRDYKNALELYSNTYRRRPKDTELGFKIARCYVRLKEYDKAVQAYEDQSNRSGGSFSRTDLYDYAEARTSIGDYVNASNLFRELVNRFPNDTLAANKLWRLNNIQYLYEDSVHYIVRPLKLNSSASDIFLAATPTEIFFLSDRPEVKLIQKTDISGGVFYNMYASKIYRDSASRKDIRFGKPTLMTRDLKITSHAGPATLYNNGNNIVFTTTSTEAGKDGKHTLQLYFADRVSTSWRVTGNFPFNDKDYSITDPSISNDGKVLYFTSDMPGGKGKKDIYRSVKNNGAWSTPENMASVNTPFDDVSPFEQPGRAFYFSSEGHPGMGGLDVFKAEFNGMAWGEVTNIGYPINSSADDFGLALDSTGTKGYFSSNRRNGGLDDDIYSVEIDIQAYPISITGLVRIKEHNWNDSSALVPFGNAHFTLIDNARNLEVYKTESDPSGRFSIVVPYFSKYKIKITGPDGDEHIASFDLPKKAKVAAQYEIVLVRDIYETTEPESPQNKEP
jgi:hypothetical protein